MPQSQVVVIGDANVDMVIRLPDRGLSSPDMTDSEPQLHGGGSAANVAVALSRLGLDVSFIGTVGDDGYGRWVRDDLDHEGIDTKGLCTVPDAFTPMVMALIEHDGERLVVIWPPEGGAHLSLQEDQINQGMIRSTAWLHTSGICFRASPARETILHTMELARQTGLTVSIDLNLRMEVWGMDSETRMIFERAIELSDVVFGNAEEEIMPISGGNTIEAAMRNLSAGVRTVIARQGDKGAMVTTPQESFHALAFPTIVVDTLGAGDAFDAGFIAARLAQLNLREAVRWGNAAAALKIGQVGARGLPSIGELKQLLGRDV